MNCPEGARETTLGCAPTENDQNPFAACGRQTLRGFFDTLWGAFPPPGFGQQPQPQLPQPLLFSHPPPHPPQKVSRRIRQMIHQQLPPKPLLFPHIEATSVCFLEHPLLVPCYSAGEKMCGNIAENHGPAPGRSPIPRMRGTAERQALPPAFMRGEGHAVAGGVSPPQRGRPSQSRFACQLSQRESQGGCALITGCWAGSFGMAENVEIFRIFPEKGVAKPWGQWYNTNVSCMKSQREGRAPLFFLNFLPGARPEEKGCAQ